ncbi:MAG: hypothetical protein QME51_09985, partial [Planctomycetota bacterium]|nr:hypothetical protein [Planctomycetota bacterium]
VQIKISDEGVYLGEEIYNLTGLEQTRTRNVASTGTTATYHIMLQNDGRGSVNDSFTVTGSAAPSNWTVSYFNGLGPFDPEIPYDQITGEGWNTGEVVTGTARYIRIEVTPTNSAATTSDIYILARSVGNTDRRDVVRAITNLRPFYVDAMVRPDGVAAWTGNDIYNNTALNQATSQPLTPTVAAAGQVTYYIRVENDGAASDTFTIISASSAPSSGWTVSFYDSGVISLPYTFTLSSGLSKTLTALISGILDIPAGEFHNLYITATSWGNTAISDTVRCTSQIANIYRPDMLLKTFTEDPAAYTGNNIYEEAITPTQLKVIELWSANQTASYTIRIENDGNITETYWITGTGSGIAGSGNWQVIYYDLSTSLDVTSQVSSTDGYNFSLGIGLSKELKAEVTPAVNVISGTRYPLYIRARSSLDPTMRDMVRADTYYGGYRPDLLYSLSSPVNYYGGNIYSYLNPPLGSPPQTIQRYGDNNQNIVYYIRLQNDGQSTATFSLSGTGGISGQWTVVYRNEGETIVTSAVVGGTHTRNINAGEEIEFPYYSVEVTPIGRAPDDFLDLFIQLRSLINPANYEQIRVRTIVSNYQPNNYIKTPSGEYT